jgi:hypothetical protein
VFEGDSFQRDATQPRQLGNRTCAAEKPSGLYRRFAPGCQPNSRRIVSPGGLRCREALYCVSNVSEWISLLPVFRRMSGELSGLTPLHHQERYGETQHRPVCCGRQFLKSSYNKNRGLRSPAARAAGLCSLCFQIGNFPLNLGRDRPQLIDFPRNFCNSLML